jgi:acyl transferase domain-containing protein
MAPTTTAMYFNEGIGSPDASCKTFDAAANGFARAEGITSIYIKRLADALRDGNPIRAVIRNTGSNSDGRSQGLMCPSTVAHEALMRKVYQQANLDPSETAFVEVRTTIPLARSSLTPMISSATEPAPPSVIQSRHGRWATSLATGACTLAR